MRILFVSQEFPPETGWGGIGTYVDVLGEALAAKGHEVHVLSAVDGQPASTRQIEGVTVHRRLVPPMRLRGVGRLPPEAFRRARLSRVVVQLVRELALEPAVIECPEWMAEGAMLGLGNQWPLVVRLHSTARQLFPHTGQGREWRGLDGRMSAWLEETSARRANIVVSTRSNLAEVAGWMRLNEAALHAIPYPVRLPEPSPTPPDSPPRVTFVGRLEARKGPETLLRAAPRVLAAVPDARFVFVGRDVGAPGAPPSSAWLRQEAERLGVTEALELTGQLERAGVDEQLRRSAVCAFPSLWESFGNVVAEASAVGRPVVTSDIPSFRELVRDGITGRIVPAADVDAWADAIVEIIRDPARAAAMGAAGTPHVRGISAPIRVADLALAAYEDAIARWRRGERAGARARPGRRRRQ